MDERLLLRNKHNQQFLTAALAWLRLLLRAKAPPAPADDLMLETPDHANGSRWWGRKPLAAARLAPPPERELQAAHKMMSDAAEVDPPPAFAELVALCGLSPFEGRVLLLCAAMELDTQIPALCARAHDDMNRPYPTFALALALFDNPDWGALSPTGALRFWRLIDPVSNAAQPILTSPLKIDERVINYLRGMAQLDDRLLPYYFTMPIPSGEALSASQHTIIERAQGLLDHIASDPLAPILQLVGADQGSQQLVAARIAAERGLMPLRLPLQYLPAHPKEIEDVIRLWQRESLLMPLALYIDMHAPELPAHAAYALHRLAARFTDVIFVAAREPFDLSGVSGRLIRMIEVSRPQTVEQHAAWQADLAASWNAPDEKALETLSGQLATQFDFNLPTIRQLAQTTDATDPDAYPGQLWQACVSYHSAHHLDALAQRIYPKATLDDLVLADEAQATLQHIVDQMQQRWRIYHEWGFERRMSRGMSISVLFSGESGTGKTMAAEALASALDLPLYRIDLSSVVNKYIGETEKNLRRIFDAADEMGVILFFDEADALFGKRGEVKDSHDRYANIEINYLLQRMEAYRGVAILATNMKSAIDPAFTRRLRFIIKFPFPAFPERQRLWKRVFPDDVPLGAIDYERLAQFNLAGGSIQSIALNASFLAAARGQIVDMSILLEAVRLEYAKTERLINSAEFGSMNGASK